MCGAAEGCKPGLVCVPDEGNLLGDDTGTCQPFNNEDFDEIKSIFPYLDPEKAQKHPYNKSIISLII